nr:retrotransposon protein, putative, Ty1-copia subclass [Tanacetum cinerariifolium]
MLSRISFHVLYGSNGIYEIDMNDLIPNVSSIYNVSTKRAKHNLDSTYLWHCRLAHLSKKRIEKMQQEGLLKSTDDESFDQCVSCLSGKMTRKSFPYSPERATDLLEIIHTDVCGLLRHVSRQCASYFFTFTDDYSHYGYVYILKHKHEVFKTFKVFKNEVKNQLWKTIKALRLDRGSEYISQEFKDYLKACGIVQQLTPPYTPQHNGVSERKNHALLDMVLSMINLSTMLLSLWDYALESAIRILNMVPTKKKIPIEVEGFEPPQEEVILIHRSERIHRAPNRLCLNVEVKEHSLGDLNEPASYKATMLDLESNKWIDAINAKIQSMIDNMVWVLVDLPPGSRLVAKGYTQLYGVDYEEMFSPVADIRAIRILISIAAFFDYEIWQMDVKTAFLNGYLDEDIYMVQHEGVNGVALSCGVKGQHPLRSQRAEPLAGVPLYLSFRDARTKRTTYVNMKFCRFKELGLGFLFNSSNNMTSTLTGTWKSQSTGAWDSLQEHGIIGQMSPKKIRKLV